MPFVPNPGQRTSGAVQSGRASEEIYTPIQYPGGPIHEPWPIDNLYRSTAYLCPPLPIIPELVYLRE
ncbi:unnamed protein product [Nezara viridula]|uniref:Uncharacterized protein n=1 Tax=Nezara viridula TaxID=85310 RepID=A0A9P0E2L9_NEZVI|nr:unnamed protein product [Nezara viridula]